MTDDFIHTRRHSPLSLALFITGAVLGKTAPGLNTSGRHNNLHHYLVWVRKGFRWWEIDVDCYLLKMMERLSILWNLRPVPEKVCSPESNESRCEQSQ